MKKFYWLFWVILISLFSFLPLLILGYFPMHDDLQVGRLYQMDLCFRDGQIPCRWVPDMGYGYGYPLFNYYPPFPYYTAEIFHLLGLSFINSIKLMFILGLIFSGIFAYLLGRELWGKWGSLVTAAFYIYAPYHAVDVYVRGALNEFWGLVFFPAVFWAVYKVIKEESKIFLAILAFSLGLLLLSHNLMAFFITPALVGWGLFVVWYLAKPLKLIWRLLIGGLWGIGLSAFFSLPVVFERHFVHLETMFIGYFNYLAHFATVNQLFFSRFWGYGPSVWGPEDGMPFPIGQLHWIVATIFLAIFTLGWFKKKIATRNYFLVSGFWILFLGSAFLAHQRSTPIWQALPVLAFAQFPWRFVGLASFFATALAGSVFVLIKNEGKAAILAGLLIIAVVSFNFSFFRPEKILKITDEEKLFSAKGWHKLQTDAIFDYLPIYAQYPPAEEAPKLPQVISSQAEIKNFQKGTNWQKFEAEVESESIIMLPTYDFPGWQVLVNGKPVEINHENELGLITFHLRAGSHRIEAKLKDTPVRAISNFISLISWVGIAGFVIKYRYGRIGKRA
jgi:hypothetical protein